MLYIDIIIVLLSLYSLPLTISDGMLNIMYFHCIMGLPEDC